TGDVLFQASNTAIRLESANALPPSSLLRFETASVNMVVELAFGDLTRSANNTTGNGGMNLTVGNGAGGFAAVGADRKVTLGGGGTIVWGTQGFAPTSSNGNSSGFQMGNVNATHKLTLTNDINLNGPASGTAPVRGFYIGNGSAAIDAEIPGVISDTGTVQATLRIGGGNGAPGPVSGTN